MLVLNHETRSLGIPTAQGGLEVVTGASASAVISPCTDIKTGTLMFLVPHGVRHLLAGYESGHVLSLDLDSNEWEGALSVAKEPMTCGCAWGELTACGASEGTIAFVTRRQNEKGKSSAEVWKTMRLPKGISDMCFRPSDGRVLVAVCWDRALRVIDCGNGAMGVLSETMFASPLHCVAFLPGAFGTCMVGDSEGEVSFWGTVSRR